VAEDGSEIREFARVLRAFDNRAEVVKALRRRMTEPVPAVRAAIKAEAIASLPSGGGLGDWVAAIKITSSTTVNGRTVRVRLRGGRRSNGGKTDVRAIDRGRVRHPSWGRRGRGDWHTLIVNPEFFTRPARDADEWPAAIRAGMVDAVRTLDG
jgi:hypothetical protein